MIKLQILLGTRVLKHLFEYLAKFRHLNLTLSNFKIIPNLEKNLNYPDDQNSGWTRQSACLAVLLVLLALGIALAINLPLFIHYYKGLENKTEKNSEIECCQQSSVNSGQLFAGAHISPVLPMSPSKMPR